MSPRNPRARHRALAVSTVLALVLALAGGVLTSVGVHGGDHAAHHGESTKVEDRHVSPRSSGQHEACWVAEVAPHERHDDLRFEDLLDVHHRGHHLVADAVASPLPVVVPAEHEVRRIVESAPVEVDSTVRSAPRRGPCQSRAPPRA